MKFYKIQRCYLKQPHYHMSIAHTILNSDICGLRKSTISNENPTSNEHQSKQEFDVIISVVIYHETWILCFGTYSSIKLSQALTLFGQDWLFALQNLQWIQSYQIQLFPTMNILSVSNNANNNESWSYLINNWFILILNEMFFWIHGKEIQNWTKLVKIIEPFSGRIIMQQTEIS